MLSRDLSNEKWIMRPTGDLAAVPASIRAAADIPAQIPGCVHTDLMRAGLILDPRVGMNELDLLWIGETDWEFRTRFELTPDQLAHERLDLACDGLDTMAELSLNGQRIGSAANMFHPHRFDLRGAARPGANDLSIIFRSPLKHIRAEEQRLGPRPVNGDWDPYIFIRKAACNFGWDWAPKVATCGVCEGIRLEHWSEMRIACVRPLSTRIAGSDRWLVDIHVELEWSGAIVREPSPRVCALILDFDTVNVLTFDTPKCEQRNLCLHAEIDSPPIWSPRVPGGPHTQPTCVLCVDACRGGGETPAEFIDSRRTSVAFREVRLNTDQDDHGEKFQLEVNGKPIFCKGANWIPEGLFSDDRPPEKIRERVRQAAAANMNMLRVWGGGFYESDEFYDECDKQGIMVWQDFMFACACYPEEPPFPQLIEAEARHQIARLSTHPSVVLWCGGNECVWGYESWGNAATDTAGPWKQRVGNKTWGAGYYYDLLPRLMRELDPTRPYWPNSPFSGTGVSPVVSCATDLPAREPASVNSTAPNSPDSGDRHTWDAVATTPAFRAIIPRFCSEFGHQSPPNIPTLARVLKPEDLAINSPALRHRQRGTGGMARHIDEPMAAEFPAPKDFAEWHANAQQMQARAMKHGLEWLLSNQDGGRCMGALIWQFNDAWPGMSWSLIDSEGTPKPAYCAVQEAFGRITP